MTTQRQTKKVVRALADLGIQSAASDHVEVRIDDTHIISTGVGCDWTTAVLFAFRGGRWVPQSDVIDVDLNGSATPEEVAEAWSLVVRAYKKIYRSRKPVR